MTDELPPDSAPEDDSPEQVSDETISDLGPEPDAELESGPAGDAAHGEREEGPASGWLEKCAGILAAGWLVVPTLQYFATVQRTGLQIDGSALLPAMATWDLTPLYYLLLGLTALWAAARFRSPANVSGDAPEAGRIPGTLPPMEEVSDSGKGS